MNEQDYEQLTLFPEASRDHASPFPLPGSAEAVRMTATSGRKCLELSRSYGPVGSLARMLLGSSIWRSTRCFLTWKVSATSQGRLLFRLVPLTLRTGGTECASWAGKKDRAIYFIPTPRAQNIPTSQKSQKERKSSPGLVDYVRMFPTPTASMAEHGGPNGRDSHGKPGLHTTSASLCGGSGNYQQLKKLEAAGEITEEERRNMAQGNGGQLNPDWVEWLMGFPIGWTSL